jgi:hypothetical protein
MEILDKEKEQIRKFIEQINKSDAIQDEINTGLNYISGEQPPRSDDEDNISGTLDLRRNDIKKYKDFIVNHIRQNPFHVDIDPKEDDPLMLAIAESLQDDIDDALNSPKGRETVECAFNTQVGVGYGYASQTLEYANSRDLKQKVCAEAIKLPQMVYFPTDDESIDGSGAKENLILRWMNKDLAEEKAGPQAVINISEWADSIYGKWSYRADSVPDITYSYIKEKTKKIYFDSNGEMAEGKQENGYSREVTHKTVCIRRFIGEALIESIDIPNMNYLPISAFRGDTNYRSDIGNVKFTYSGIYQRVKDLQEILNYLLVEAVELASNASKAPFIAEESQLEGHEDAWESYNRVPTAVLYYKAKSANGQLLPPPQRADNSAQVEWILSYARQIEADIMNTLGFTPAMMGNSEYANDSARATAMRQSVGGITISAMLDNCGKSLQHMACIATELAIFAKPKREITYTPEDSEEEQTVIVDLGEQAVDSNDFMYRLTQGPANESKRQQSLNALLEIGKMDPQAFGGTLDLVVERMDIPNVEDISKRIEKLIEIRTPELIEKDAEAPDPEAIQALQAQEQAMQEMEQAHEAQMANAIRLNEQLQNELQNRDKEIEGRLIQEQMKQDGENARNTQDNATDIAEAKIKQGQEVDKESIKQTGETERAVIQQVATPERVSIDSDIEPTPNLSSPVLGGAQLNED